MKTRFGKNVRMTVMKQSTSIVVALDRSVIQATNGDPAAVVMLDCSVLVFQFRRKRARPDNYPRAWLQISNNVRSNPRFRSSSCYLVGCIAAALGFTALGFVVRGVVVIFHSLLNLLDIHYTRRSGTSSTPPWPRQACSKGVKDSSRALCGLCSKLTRFTVHAE